ncbi:DUF3180 family protein, partial [Escherichia coli]|uniref:DUF3180 family protein n=1 Tax=Escherichia coli TaxID=562 RepID=UPI0015CB6DE4
GAGIGILTYLLTRDVLPTSNAVLLTALGTAGAIILLIAGLLAELFCTLPPDSDDDPETARARSH